MHRAANPITEDVFAMKNILFFLFCLSVLLLLPYSARSEFYEYVDENGVKTFTNDPGRVPQAQADGVKIHKEPYDDLPEAERQRMIEAEAARLEEIEKQQAEAWERYEQEKRLRDLEKEEAGKKKELERNSTPVVITPNNQILVPVSLGYGGKTVSANLLLDTGANMTIIHDDIAERLDIDGGRKGNLIVAGGDKIRTRQLFLQFIAVGPKSVTNPRISILTYKGKDSPFDGLLGLDFLRQFKYTVDYEKSLIIWNE